MFKIKLFGEHLQDYIRLGGFPLIASGNFDEKAVYANKEIDFIAINKADRLYIQVCRQLPKESDREIANLMEVNDHYPKFVVTLDDYASGNINGIQIVHLADFLLNE